MARAHALRTTDVTLAHRGWALTHDLYSRDGRKVLRKGTVLDAAALAGWPDVAPGEAHLLEFDADDVHEDIAGLRIAQAVSGAGLRVTGPLQSRYDVVAERKGLLRVDAELLRAVNRVEGVTAYSLLDRQPVLPNKVVASVKITPITISAALIAVAEQRCWSATRAPLTVLPFLPQRVAVVATDDVSPPERARFQAAIERKLRWYGSELTDLRFVASNVSHMAAAFEDCLHDGNDVLLAAGGNTIDPLDVIEQALPLIGARLIHRGAPTRGSMFWLAQVGAAQIINLASCAMYVGSTVADLILPLVMTGQQVTSEDIIALGYGGLPGPEMAFRFPPYDAESDDDHSA